MVKMLILIIGGILFLLCIVCAAYFLGRSSVRNIPKTKTTSSAKTAKAQTPKNVSCTRTTRLPNAPQYDRTLSLIYQRVKDNVEWWEKYGDKNKSDEQGFKVFPAQLTNCIKVIESEVTGTTDAEGSFTFNSKDIKPNYYPITVNSSYSLTDDVLTALLLSHEMTHVQQYINQLNGKDSLSCIDKEIDAFMAQLDFYTTLNSEENSSVIDRIQSDKNLHPQLQMIKVMTTINREAECDFIDSKCKDKNLRSKLKDMFLHDEIYKKECNL